jgi:hypothetical protein
MIAISRRWFAGSSIRAAVSTALRNELSGFLISWATSAAKLSIALICSVSVISRSEPERSPISSPRRVRASRS